MPKERPIIFAAESVRAILAGNKAQTRRIVKPQPPVIGGYPHDGGESWHWGIYLDRPHAGPYVDIGRCPYGVPGDRLWVKEAWLPVVSCEDADGWFEWKPDPERPVPDDGYNEPEAILYATDNQCFKLRNPIFMPRWASRITLEITDIRVQRVQEISEEDAITEGCKSVPLTQQDIDDIQISDASPNFKALARALGVGQFTAKQDFAQLWDSINAKRGYSWKSNPWAWALSFKRETDGL